MDEAFEDEVRRALANFYDPAYLETGSLVNLLIGAQEAQGTRGLRLRALLAETVERLKPQPAVPFGRQEWFPYRILRQRYLEAMAIDDVCQEIGLSRTTYYRYHREGLQAVAEILWREHATDQQRPPLKENASAKSTDRAVSEAHRLTLATRQEWVDLEKVLERVMATIRPLAHRDGVAVQVVSAEPLPVVCGDHVVLRQILLNLLSESLVACPAKSLTLQVWVEEQRTRWTLGKLSISPDQAKHPSALPGVGVSQALLEGCGGALWIEAEDDGQAQICFEIPVGRATTILILDDNPETVELYTRYLMETGYHLLCASSLAEYRRLVQISRPDLVLLDVLMPDEDGWTVLQETRLNEALNDVPVLICSVLSQPRLALSLGADAVLQKPVAQEVLLQTIERLLHPPDS